MVKKISLFTLKIARLINSGKTISDKFYIFIWLFNQQKGIKKSIFIKNSDGVFYLPKGFKNVWVTSPFGERAYKSFMNLEKGTFIDVGANIGKYTIIVGNKLKEGKVVSIEPEKKNYEILKNNIKLNKLSSKVILENAAAYNKDGEITLNISEFEGRHSIKTKSSKKIKVSTITLDSLVKKYNLKNIN